MSCVRRLSVTAPNLSALDLGSISFKVAHTEYWPLVASLIGTPGVTLNVTGPTSANVTLAIDLTALPMSFSGCDTSGFCGFAAR